MEYKVSIVIPIYGVEKYIERCARSLFEQTYHNIEYIFVNDCTKDSSIEVLLSVLEEYPNRKAQVKIIHHEKNKGLSGARNTGVSNITGDYMWHVDSDDYVDINAVEILVNETQRTDADIVIFGQNNVYTHQIIPCSIKKFEKNEYIKKLLLNYIGASMWNKFYKTSFYKQTNILSDEEIGQGEDYAVVPRILYHTDKIVWLDKHLYNYNLTNQNSYSNNISKYSIMSLKKADDIVCDFFKDKSEYSDVIDLIYLRSMLFLIKTSCKECYNDIISIYSNVKLVRLDRRVSLSDKLIIFLIRMRWFEMCAYLIKIVRSNI